MRYQYFPLSHFSFLQVKLNKGAMKYLKSSDWGLQGSAFFPLRAAELFRAGTR